MTGSGLEEMGVNTEHLLKDFMKENELLFFHRHRGDQLLKTGKLFFLFHKALNPQLRTYQFPFETADISFRFNANRRFLVVSHNKASSAGVLASVSDKTHQKNLLNHHLLCLLKNFFHIQRLVYVHLRRNQLGC